MQCDQTVALFPCPGLCERCATLAGQKFGPAFGRTPVAVVGLGQGGRHDQHAGCARVHGVTNELPAEAMELIGITLPQRLRETRQRFLAVYADLPNDYWDCTQVPYAEVINPPLWEFAHVAWFQEYWCLRYSRELDGPARESWLENADALFDSRRVPHRDRWTASYPTKSTILSYLERTLDAVAVAVEGLAGREHDTYFGQLSLHHEQMHTEALLMTLETLGVPMPASFPRPTRLPADESWIEVPAGVMTLGATRDAAHFLFDNEKFAHELELSGFRIADRPVRNDEFLAFIKDDGMCRDDLWTLEGRAWRDSQAGSRAWAARHASYQSGDELDGEAHWGSLPVSKVTLHEARAYCRWAGRRLPSEAEWEAVARREGCMRHAGQVWEWTDTPFNPYPEFSPDPYREYSLPWFGNHYVLRGGSWLTHDDLKRPGFRNFYLPHRNDVFAGFRTCAV